jgi:hypothetical protein
LFFGHNFFISTAFGFGVAGRRLKLDQGYRMVYVLWGLQLNPEAVDLSKEMPDLKAQFFQKSTASGSERMGGNVMLKLWHIVQLEILPAETFQSFA